MKALTTKLAKIGSELNEYVPKTGHNEHGNYDYVTEAKLASVVREKLFKAGIVAYPNVEHYEHTQFPGKKSIITTITGTFLIVDGDSGENLGVPFVGVGQDTGDKGVYKAITGAEKYLWMKLFLLPTGDDPEKSGPADTEPTEATVVEHKQNPPDVPEGAVLIERISKRKKGYGVKVDGEWLTIWDDPLAAKAEHLCKLQIPCVLETKAGAAKNDGGFWPATITGLHTDDYDHNEARWEDEHANNNDDEEVI
jgi:hypothetical protein